MISVEDACQTYGIEPETIEQWIVQDGVDYRYIWRGDTKVRMVPRSWLMERTAGAGLRPQLLDDQGRPIGEGVGDLPVSQQSFKPSHGEQRAFEMMQQVVNLQEHQEKRISRSNRFYGAVFLLAFVVIAVGVFYTLMENKTSIILSSRLSEFAHRAEIEEQRGALQKQLLGLQTALQAADTKEDLLQERLDEERALNLQLLQREKELSFKLNNIEVAVKNRDLQQLSQRNFNRDRELAAERKKNIELDKKQAELSHKLQTADLHRELLELRADLQKAKKKLEQRDQQIRNLQLMIGK